MTTATKKNIIRSKTIGFRNAMNTDWPRSAHLRRVRDFGGKIVGYSVEVATKGISDSYREHKTRTEAEQAYEDLGPGEEY